MPRSAELDSLFARKQEAFGRKQAAFQKYVDARNRANEAHDKMQSAWDQRVAAREEMNREFESMQQSKDSRDAIWADFNRLCQENSSRINQIRQEADMEHEMMKNCFDSASAAYEYGNKADAPMYASEGHMHKDRRDDLNAEVGRLIQEINNAKANAKWQTSSSHGNSFQCAKSNFDNAKMLHESAEAEFKSAKAERDAYKTEFDSAQAEFERLKDACQRKLDEIKANNRKERERILDKAGVGYLNRQDAKIVKKADGTTQVYHGGLGSGDGLFHGHVALDQSGNKTYSRDAFEKHGSQNYTDRKTGERKSNGGWTELSTGTIFDSAGNGHNVMFRQGLGKNEGQTLIRDYHGFESKNNFHEKGGHNHYGNSDKRLYPNEPDRIEDSSRHRNDNSYTGPGH